MLFQETWTLLQSGKTIARDSAKLIYVSLPKGCDYLFKIESTDRFPKQYIPTIQDLLASDWQVVE